jgi:hypothetical protein
MSLRKAMQARHADWRQVASRICSYVQSARGSSAAKACKHSAECLGCDANRGHVSGRDLGRILVGVEGSELLHDLGCNGGEGRALQAACGMADVAYLQEGVHTGHERALRWLRWAAVVEARSLDASRDGLWRLWMGSFMLCSLECCQDASVLAFAG